MAQSIDARVIGFSMSTDAELGKMMHIAAAAKGQKHVAWVRSIMIEAVNAANLKKDDGSDWKYVTPSVESLKEQNARLQAEAAAMVAELAEMRAFKAAQKALEEESLKELAA